MGVEKLVAKLGRIRGSRLELSVRREAADPDRGYTQYGWEWPDLASTTAILMQAMQCRQAQGRVEWGQRAWHARTREHVVYRVNTAYTVDVPQITQAPTSSNRIDCIGTLLQVNHRVTGLQTLSGCSFPRRLS